MKMSEQPECGADHTIRDKATGRPMDWVRCSQPPHAKEQPHAAYWRKWWVSWTDADDAT